MAFHRAGINNLCVQSIFTDRIQNMSLSSCASILGCHVNFALLFKLINQKQLIAESNTICFSQFNSFASCNIEVFLFRLRSKRLFSLSLGTHFQEAYNVKLCACMHTRKILPFLSLPHDTPDGLRHPFFINLTNTDRSWKQSASIITINRNKLSCFFACLCRNLVSVQPHTVNIICDFFLTDDDRCLFKFFCHLCTSSLFSLSQLLYILTSNVCLCSS